MPKLSPEAQARRNESYRQTMAAKRVAKQNGLEPATATEVMAADAKATEWVKEVLDRNPVKGKNDARVELARDIVKLLQRVLQ